MTAAGSNLGEYYHKL